MDDSPKDPKIAGLPKAPLRYFTMSRRLLASIQGIIMTAIKLKGFVNAIRILLGAVGLGLLLVGSASAAPPDKDVNDAYWWWGHDAGNARIVRTNKGISGNIKVHLGNDEGSAKGLAVTLWLIIFNNPDECVEGPGMCGADGVTDFTNPDVMPDAVYGGGNIVGASERARIGFHYKAGENTGSIADLFGMPVDDNDDSFGLIYPRDAEVHYVLRFHGPLNPEEMPAQIQSYGGGCDVGNNYPYGFLPPASSAELQLGLGDCQDVIFAINPPPE